MTIPTFPSLPGLAFPVGRKPMMDTITQKPVSGKETRLQLWTYPRRQFTLSYNVLPAGLGTGGINANTDLQTLEGFFNSVAGSALPFHWTDPYDNAVVAASLGTGNASTVSYNFIRPFGGFVEPIQDVTQNTVSVYVDDYQGNLLWLNTARTNYVKYSQAVSTSPWALAALSATTGQTDPEGGTTAIALKETAVTSTHSTTQTIASPLPANSTNLVLSAFIAPLTRTIAYMKVTNLAGTTYSAYFNLSSTGTIGTTVGAGIVAGITQLTNGYYRCWFEFPSGATGSTAPVITITPSASGSDAGNYAGNTSDGLYVWGVQLENNTTVGNYIPTTTVQLAQTDYAFQTDANWGLTYGITFAVAPANSAAITWTGSYQWACRLDEDSTDFNNFMYNYFELKKISFTSMKVV